MDTEAPPPASRSGDLSQTFGALPTGSELTATLKEATKRVLQRRFRVVLLIRDAYDRLEANTDALSAVWDDIQAVLRLLVAWTKQSYRRVSGGALLLLVAALVYFVTPVDVIPDPLGAMGFIDDIAVIETAVEAVRTELNRFRAWEETHSLSS